MTLLEKEVVMKAIAPSLLDLKRTVSRLETDKSLSMKTDEDRRRVFCLLVADHYK